MPTLPVPSTVACDRLLTVGQVAERLSLSARTVWKLCSSGELPPPLKIGGARRWRESDISRYIEALAESQKR